MKILQVIHKSQMRGAEIFACQLSNNFIQLGHEVKIVAVYEGDANNNLPFHGKIISLNASPGFRFFDLFAWKKLAKIIKEFNPDVVQVNAGDTLKYAVFSKKMYKWEHPIVSRNASEISRYFKHPIQKQLNFLFHQNVRFVVSVSRPAELDILSQFPNLEGRTCVIPVGLEQISEFPKFQLKPVSSRHLVHVGAFTFEKNHLGLLRIFRRVLNSTPGIQLHLLGDGPLKKEIQKKVKEMHLDSKVTFYGSVNNPLSYIEAADVLVLPSIIEGLPGVLLEAMICKTPVIAYGVGGIAGIVSPRTGSLIKKNDEETFANTIIEILRNPNRSQVAAAYEMVLKDYTNGDIALKFIEIYEKVVREIERSISNSKSRTD